MRKRRRLLVANSVFPGSEGAVCGHAGTVIVSHGSIRTSIQFNSVSRLLRLLLLLAPSSRILTDSMIHSFVCSFVR